jgi:curved DNA-binding protein CbpA
VADYYELLGIRPNAAHAELRRAWRRLALRWHPDRAGSSATAIFQKIQAAYAVLSDPMSRAAYDRRKSVPVRATRRQAPGVRLHRLSGPLAGLLACGIAVRSGNDIIELFINPDEAESGGMVTIPMRVPVRTAGGQVVDELFTAWLAVPPGVQDGEILPPSALLPGMIHRVLFRVRLNRS